MTDNKAVIDLSKDTDGSDCSESVPDSSSNIKKKLTATTAIQTKKQQLAEEKAAKKRANQMNKVYNPTECMKYMNVEGHPSLWCNWWCSDVGRELSAAGARLVHSSQLVHPSLVVFTRNVPRTLDTGDGALRLSPLAEPCNRALYVAQADDIATHVCAQSLAPHVAEMKALVGCPLTLLVFCDKDYFKASKRKTSNSNRTPMTELALELAITDLLVSAECDTAVVSTPNEVALFILQMTKAIAEGPHKLRKRAIDEQAQFYMRGVNKHCVAIDTHGMAVGALWQQMVAILPNSSLETSRAICAKYSTPLHLFESLQSDDSATQLADIGVSRAAVPGSKARRVGPEFARKLRTLFTAEDGNTIID